MCFPLSLLTDGDQVTAEKGNLKSLYPFLSSIYPTLRFLVEINASMYFKMISNLYLQMFPFASLILFLFRKFNLIRTYVKISVLFLVFQSPLPRGYPPPSTAMLFDDDPGIMSEVETSSTGFRRGGKQRSSLPVVRTPSKTLERPLGNLRSVVFPPFVTLVDNKLYGNLVIFSSCVPNCDPRMDEI